MIKKIEVAGRVIGDGFKTFIIAEAGANWKYCRDMDLNYKHAIKLINIAADSGADAVKFQVYRAAKLYVKSAGHAGYIGKNKPIYDIIKDMEIPYEWIPELKDRCDKRGIVFLATPFDEESVIVLEKAAIELYKIASYTISHLPLVEMIARLNKPIILSTGASNIADIDRALETVSKWGNDRIALMQCTARYPASLETINLRVISTLKNKYDIPVGLSDHSRNPIVAPLGAVSIGANILEKHFTTDNSLDGPDHGFALLPEEFKMMVDYIRMMERAIGSGVKEIQKEEEELHGFCRRKIYAVKDILQGESFSEDNIGVLRSGHAAKGLDPLEYGNAIGKRARIRIKAGDPITKEVLDE
ncbi:MAG: N-acetylneuraminate synthase family protein [Candidatus Omnitrophota bacterium]